MKPRDKYDEMKELANDFWFQTGRGAENRGSTLCQLETGGVFDITDLLAYFALRLPYQQQAAMLAKPDLYQLHQIAKHLLDHDPYKKALEDHMACCPGPPLLILRECPHCKSKLTI